MKPLFIQSDKMITHLISAVFKALGFVPRSWTLAFGNFLGRVWYRFDKNRKSITLDNLTRAFENEKNPAQIEALARQVFINVVQIVFEIIWSLRLKDRDLARHFYIKNEVNLKAAHKKKKGVLLLSGHTGNWELLGVAVGMLDYSFNNIYKPLRTKPLDRFAYDIRTRFGLKLIIHKRSMRKILRALKRGECVNLFLDQSVDWYEGVFVDFFGRRTCTNTGLALLALKTGAPVVPVFLIRDGKRFRVEFGREVPLIKTGDKTKDVEANTQQYTKIIEAYIRRYPDQWLWIHRRWKVRPYQPWPRQ